jgi:hypothetical protein
MNRGTEARELPGKDNEKTTAAGMDDRGGAAATKPVRPTGVAAIGTRLAALFVWSVWGLTAPAALVLVWNYTPVAVPQGDEWYYVQELTGERPVTLDWLWTQHAEHRIPLAKLIWVGVLRLTNYDFRVGTALVVLALATTAFAMICTARSLRGRTSLSDAFFPLALLSLGQSVNLFWWWQVILHTARTGSSS